MEVWKSIKGYESYDVSNFGRIRSLKSNKILIQSTNRGGYYKVNLFCNKVQRTLLVHRLVAEAFHPGFNPELTIDHIDGNKVNNHISNLEPVTSKENIKRYLHGSSKENIKRYQRGASYNTRQNKWQSRICFNMKLIYLGSFDTKEEAQKVYYTKYIELHGDEPWDREEA